MRWIIVPVACALVAGCAPYSSYPPVERTSGLTHSSFEPVPTIMVTSLEWARSMETGAVAERPLAFTLPRDSSDGAYRRVQKKIEGSHRAEAGEAAVAIRSVRVRGFDATVDISIPRDRGEPILYTLDLKSKPFQNWEVVGHRRWRFHETDIAAVDHMMPAEASAQVEADTQGE
ncbi:MAG: hypothetical protein VX727_02235 [Planctomycetota bacterium]|nr:hypothetical protein [Planctomycetota bacterium]